MIFPFPLPLAAFLQTAAPACPAAPAPAVEVSFSAKQAPVYNNVTSQNLPNPRNQYSNVTENDFPMVGGITHHEIKVDKSYTTTAGVYFPATQQHCRWPVHFVLNIEYEPTVYIAAEFRPGTCRYNTTLTHEYKHVQTETQTIRAYLPQIRRAAEEAAKSVGARGPFPAASLEAVDNRIVGDIMTNMNGPILEMINMLQLRQRAIDTVVEYTRTSQQCAGQP